MKKYIAMINWPANAKATDKPDVVIYHLLPTVTLSPLQKALLQEDVHDLENNDAD